MVLLSTACALAPLLLAPPCASLAAPPAFTTSVLVAGPAASAVEEVEAVTLPPPPLVTYPELVRRRRELMHRPVRIVLQVGAELSRWNPGLTRFGRRDYRAFEAWSDERLPWVVRDVAAPEHRIFLPRGGPFADRLENARPFQRYEATVIVRELFAGRPWMEVLAMIRLPERVDEGTVIHAGRALRLMNERQWRLALVELERAVVPGLPPRPLAELQGLTNVCKGALAGYPPPGMGDDRADRLRRRPLGD